MTPPAGATRAGGNAPKRAATKSAATKSAAAATKSGNASPQRPRKAGATAKVSASSIEALTRRLAELEGEVAGLRQEAQSAKAASTTGSNGHGPLDVTALAGELVTAMQLLSGPTPPRAQAFAAIGHTAPTPVLSSPLLPPPVQSVPPPAGFVPTTPPGWSPRTLPATSAYAAALPRRRAISMDAVLPIIAVVIVLMIVLAWVG